MKKTKAIKCVLGLIALSYLAHISEILLWLWKKNLLSTHGTIYADWTCVLWNGISIISLILLIILVLIEKE